MSETTELNEEELALADLIAKAQWKRASRRGAAPAHGHGAQRGTAGALEAHRIGSRGEVAIAKLLDLYPNLSTFEEEKARGGFDFPHRIGVRAAKKRFGLLVRPGDPPEGRYVAVFVQEARVEALGWDDGHAAKQEEWLRAPDGRAPCYLKPERLLQPLSNLRAVIAAERAAAFPMLEAEPARPPLRAGRSFEFPPDSGRVAHYSSEEVDFLRPFWTEALAHPPGHPVRLERACELRFLHELKAEFGGELEGFSISSAPTL